MVPSDYSKILYRSEVNIWKYTMPIEKAIPTALDYKHPNVDREGAKQVWKLKWYHLNDIIWMIVYYYFPQYIDHLINFSLKLYSQV